jgi:hypothetical protein
VHIRPPRPQRAAIGGRRGGAQPEASRWVGVELAVASGGAPVIGADGTSPRPRKTRRRRQSSQRRARSTCSWRTRRRPGARAIPGERPRGLVARVRDQRPRRVVIRRLVSMPSSMAMCHRPDGSVLASAVTLSGERPVEVRDGRIRAARRRCLKLAVARKRGLSSECGRLSEVAGRARRPQTNPRPRRQTRLAATLWCTW